MGLVAMVVGLVGTAQAQTPQTPQTPQAQTPQAQTPQDERVDLLSRAAALSNAGDHLGAVELLGRVYRGEEDLDLLVSIGAEYRKAGKAAEAIQNYCTYLSLEPQGERAPFAQAEVVALQSERGLGVNFANVCAPAQPMLPPLAPATFEREQPTTNSGMSQREIVGIGGVAAGLVSLTAGVVYGMRARDISDQMLNHDPATPWPANIRELEERGQHDERMEVGFLLAGALVVGTGTYLYVSGRHHRMETEQRVSVGPSVSRSGAGLAISGSF